MDGLPAACGALDCFYPNCGKHAGKPGGASGRYWNCAGDYPGGGLNYRREIPWILLDIASTAWLGEAEPYMAKAPTGICVRSFI